MKEDTMLPGVKADEFQEEPKDWTRFVWVGILALILIMSVSFYFVRDPRPANSMVRARHILISFDANDPVDRGRAHERISELHKRIISGESFEQLARDNSDDTVTARRGGDLGWAPRGTYAATFEEYCWKGEVGKISDIIQTQYGFHIIRVEDRHITSAELYEKEIERKVLESSGGEGEP